MIGITKTENMDHLAENHQNSYLTNIINNLKSTNMKK